MKGRGMQSKGVIIGLMLACFWAHTAIARQTPDADLMARAETWKSRARAAYQAGQHAEALWCLEKAYTLHPDPGYRANRVPILEAMGRYVEALSTLRWYLDTRPGPKKRAIAEDMMARLAPQMTIRTTPPGAQVYLDGRESPIGVTPYSGSVVAGDHRLKLVLGGHHSVHIGIQVKPGKPLQLRRTLLPVPPLNLQQSPPPRVSRRGPWGYVFLSAALVSAGVTGYFFAEGQSAASARDSARNRNVWRSQNEQALQMQEGYQISLGITALATVGSLLFFIYDMEETDRSDPQRPYVTPLGVSGPDHVHHPH
ncbi:MAG: PEGA domain-containing protein [Bradymonadia bacterium]